MTDNEIIKAFKVLKSWLWRNYHNATDTDKERAELCEAVQTIFNAKKIPEMFALTKAEAYKEFAEKVKEEITEALKNNYKVRAEKEQAIPIYTENELLNYCTGKIDCLRGLDDFLDNLLKEMVGEDK